MTNSNDPKSIGEFSPAGPGIGEMLSRSITTIVLAIIFFLVVTPLGMLMRMTGRDPMARQAKKDQESCRVDSKVRAATHLKKTY